MSYKYAKHRRSDDHADIDDWLMTYADMITLLLCFFAVMLALSMVKKEAYTEARRSVIEQFGSKDFLAGKFPTPPTPISQSGGNYDALPSIVDRFHTGEGRTSGDGIQSGEGQESAPAIDAADQTNTQTQQNGTTSETPSPAEDPPQGDRIMTIEMPSAAFFASGSASLSDDGKEILADLYRTQLLPATQEGYNINIEGHTDDVPINTLQFPSNWELSTARAAAVVRFFIAIGAEPQHLSASGYANIFPKVPNMTASGQPIPENRAQNRRVIIKLEKIEKQE